MKVTIGIPVYGVELYIERCAISIFEQTYNDLEIIFVDDCTPDRSIEVLRNVLDRYPQREKQVKILRHERNRGLAAARNTAVEHATGDFLLWVDSDDYIDKTLVEKCVEKQKETRCDIVLFDFLKLLVGKSVRTFQGHCMSSRERTLKLLARQVQVCVWGGFYRLSLYKDHGIRAVEGVNNNEDYQVSPRLSYYSRSIAYIDEALYFYDCMSGISITQNFNISQAEQGWKSLEILEDFFKDKGEDYMAAIRYSYIARIATYKKWTALADEKEYYKHICMKQKGVTLKEICQQKPYKWPLLMINNFRLLRLYALAGTKIQKMLI